MSDTSGYSSEAVAHTVWEIRTALRNDPRALYEPWVARIEALAAENAALRAKLAEAEAERDRLRGAAFRVLSAIDAAKNAGAPHKLSPLMAMALSGLRRRLTAPSPPPPPRPRIVAVPCASPTPGHAWEAYSPERPDIGTFYGPSEDDAMRAATEALSKALSAAVEQSGPET